MVRASVMITQPMGASGAATPVQRSTSADGQFWSSANRHGVESLPVRTTWRLGQAGVAIGVVWTLVKGVWAAVGFGQQANQLVEDLPAFVRALDTPWSGGMLSLASALVIGAVWYADTNLKPASLKDKWFHTVDGRGNIVMQGKVLRDERGRLFVQLFDFTLGDPSVQRYLTETERKDLRVYDTNAAMQDEFYRLHPELHRW